ncbi:MAG: glycosyltransferase, partial [Candidatus Omnitrophica bacterium]|nr:glycosyltransferase [Candidatus Omnitrophota bacterium]
IDSAKSDNASIKFKVLCQSSNNGIYGALNMGIGALEADVVFILHSDDWYEPKAAENVISVFDKNPEADIVIGRAMFYKNGRDASPVLKNNRSFSLFPVLHPVIHPACFVKRDVYGRIGNFNENYLVSADYDFTYRCYKSGINFLKCHEHLVNVQKGGFGWKNKNIAMCENLRIGLKHGRNNIFPKLAYLLRVLLNR